jgi:hypothetical protein
MLGISKAAEKIGFHIVGGRLPCKEQAHPSELKLFFRLLTEEPGRN